MSCLLSDDLQWRSAPPVYETKTQVPRFLLHPELGMMMTERNA